MINERAVYISMHTSLQYLHLARPRINDPANRWWSANPQLLIISDNESLWKLINIWSLTAWTSISRRGREVTTIDARCDLYPRRKLSRAITPSVARPGSLGNFVPVCLFVYCGCLSRLLLATGGELFLPLEMNQISKDESHNLSYKTQDEHAD